MSTTKRTVPYRRKREGKTNFKKRLELLKGQKNRLVIRRTNKHIIYQVVSYHPDGDKVLFGMSSKKLESFGWKHSSKSIPAAYLGGLLFGKEASKKNISDVILDLGLQSPIKGSKLYAALKGVQDGGLSVVSSDDIYPVDDRLMGKHISEGLEKDVSASKEKILG